MERTILDRFDAITDGDGATVFKLKAEPERSGPARATFDDEPSRQRTLLAGLDCLPGQLDFLDDSTNGESDK